ncbi:MAG: hypothetical protein Q9170_004240 [Blastenia crenularia]
MFAAILENRNGLGGQTWTDISLDIDVPKSVWARYALADNKASLPNRITTSKDFTWLTRLMISKHPIMNDDPLRQIPAFYPYDDPPDLNPEHFPLSSPELCMEAYAIALYYALGMISDGKDCTIHAWLSQRNQLHRMLGLEDYKQILTAHYHISSELQRDLPRETVTMKERIRALLAVSILSSELRNSQGDVPAIPLAMIPTTQTIPFDKLLSLPPPFSSSSPEDLLNCQKPAMNNPSFFEDGEWVGIYSTSFTGVFPLEYDAPMRGMHFESNFDLFPPPTFRLTASGQDLHGGFELIGGFNPESKYLSSPSVSEQSNHGGKETGEENDQTHSKICILAFDFHQAHNCSDEQYRAEKYRDQSAHSLYAPVWEVEDVLVTFQHRYGLSSPKDVQPIRLYWSQGYQVVLITEEIFVPAPKYRYRVS